MKTVTCNGPKNLVVRFVSVMRQKISISIAKQSLLHLHLGTDAYSTAHECHSTASFYFEPVLCFSEDYDGRYAANNCTQCNHRMRHNDFILRQWLSK
jgi:hypothetical protein